MKMLDKTRDDSKESESALGGLKELINRVSYC